MADGIASHGIMGGGVGGYITTTTRDFWSQSLILLVQRRSMGPHVLQKSSIKRAPSKEAYEL